VHTKSRSLTSAIADARSLELRCEVVQLEIGKGQFTDRVRVSLVIRSGPQFHCVDALLFLGIAVHSHFVALASLSFSGVNLLELARQGWRNPIGDRGTWWPRSCFLLRGSFVPWTRNSRVTRRGAAVFSPCTTEHRRAFDV